MARANRSTARGTRLQSPFSAYSIADSVGYMVSGATAFTQFVHGLMDTANNTAISGSSITVDTGLTTIYSLSAEQYRSGTTDGGLAYMIPYWTGSEVTVELKTSSLLPASAANGVSIAWFAFGV